MLKNFNDYQIDLVEKSLTYKSVEVEIEPLVMEVLVYLILNNDRYIDINELHLSLWANRVVSDSAVRRTIVKLRALLNDDSNNPTYIKSATRRGYRFIHELEDVISDDQLADDSAEATTVSTKGNSFQLKSFVSLGLVALVALVILFIDPNINKDVLDQEKEQMTFSINSELFDLYGKSLSPVYHPSKPIIAFSHKSQKNSPYDLFTMNMGNRALRQLTNGEFSFHNPFWISDDSLLAMAVNKEQCQIVRVSLPKNDEKANISYLHKCVAGQLNINFNPVSQNVFFSDKRETDNAFSLYRYDLEKSLVTAYSSPPDKGIGDYLSAISIDGNSLAFVRTVTGEATTIFIENIASGKLLNKIDFTGDVNSLFWLNDQEIIYLNKNTLSLFNIVSSEILSAAVDQSVVAIYPNSQTPYQPLVIQSKEMKYMLEELDNPFVTEQENSRTISYSNNAISSIYGEGSDEIFYLSESGIELFLRSESMNIALPIEERIDQVELLGVHLDKHQVLMRLNNQIAFYDWVSKQLIYITKEANRISNASFSKDGQLVFYPIEKSGNWSIKQYDIASSEVTTFLEGAISIKNYNNGYAVILEDNQLALLSASGDLQRVPNIYIQISDNTSWTINEHYLYYTSQGQEEISMHRFNLDNGAQRIKAIEKGTFDGRFSLSMSGNKLIRIMVPTFLNSVLKAKLDLNKFETSNSTKVSTDPFQLAAALRESHKINSTTVF